MRVVITYLLAIMFIIVLQADVFAQNGNIEGKLYNFQFMFVKWGNPGQNKVILQNDTGFYRETNSDAKGRYLFTDIPPGDYLIKVDCKAELKDLGLCNLTGSLKVSVKSNKTTRADIKIYKM